MNTEQINKAIDNARDIQPESPLPLRRAIKKPNDFPVEFLPNSVREAVHALYNITRAPTALCAQSILAAINVVTQGRADIKLPHGEIRPISCYFLTIAESGERKTTCDDLALKAVRNHEANLRSAYRRECSEWQNKHDIREKIRTGILRNKRGQDKHRELDQLGPPPPKPLLPIILCDDPTIEGLLKMLNESQPDIGIFSSEGGQFLGGYSMGPDNKIKTASTLSKMWDGSDLSIIRSLSGINMITGKRIAMHLMAQPDMCLRFLSDKSLLSQGLLSRFLVTFPASTIGTRFINALSTDDHHRELELFTDSLEKTLKTPSPVTRNGTREFRVIDLDNEASELYREFYNEIERRMITDLTDIKGFASKLPEHAVRLSATMALFDNPELTTLSGEHLRNGIGIARFYLNEAVRLFACGMTDPNILLAEKLLDWLCHKWPENDISLPDIYQRGLSAIKDKATATRIVRILEDHGWLRKNPVSTIVNGRRRKEIWSIVRPSSANTTAKDAANNAPCNNNGDYEREERSAIMEFDGELYEEKHADEGG